MKTRIIIWLMCFLSCIVLIAYASEKDAGMGINDTSNKAGTGTMK